MHDRDLSIRHFDIFRRDQKSLGRSIKFIVHFKEARNNLNQLRLYGYVIYSTIVYMPLFVSITCWTTCTRNKKIFKKKKVCFLFLLLFLCSSIHRIESKVRLRSRTGFSPDRFVHIKRTGRTMSTHWSDKRSKTNKNSSWHLDPAHKISIKNI